MATPPPRLPPRPIRESSMSSTTSSHHPLASSDAPPISHKRSFSKSGNPLQSPTNLVPSSSVSVAAIEPLPPAAMSFGPPSSSNESATTKLQFQTMQAAVQKGGLRHDSAGWLLVLSLVNGYMSEPKSQKGKEKERTEYERWEKLVRLLEMHRLGAAFEVHLLLPRDALGYYQHIGSSFLAAHLLIVACEVKEGCRQAVTLSGLRGFVDGDNKLTLCSCTLGFPFADKADNLSDPQFQESLIGPALQKASGSDYPKHQLEFLPTLNIPRHNMSSFSEKSGDSAKSSSTRRVSSAATSRIASLFGGTGSAVKGASPSSEVTESTSQPESLVVKVICLDKVLRWRDVVKSVKKADESHIRTQLQARLADIDGLSTVEAHDVVDKVSSFLKIVEPPSPTSVNSNDWRLSFKEKDKQKSLGNLFVLAASDPLGAEMVSSSLQDLYEAGRNCVKVIDTDDEKAVFDEHIANEVTETVEACLTDALYDRLFCVPSSMDAIDDESLASKNAGLNLLELSLEHLGLEVGDPSSAEEDDSRDARDVIAIRVGLDAMLAECDAELTNLEDPSRRTPRSKLEVLIRTHQIIVERLSAMPAIPMKREQNAKAKAAPSLQERPKGEYELVDSHPSSPTSRSPARGLPAPSLSEISSTDFQTDQILPQIVVSSQPIEAAAEKEQNKPKSTSSSADLILPLLIFCVVRSNPHQLASNLAFIHRFRASSLLSGEAHYCLVNMQAVVDFVLNIDKHMAALGLSPQGALGSIPPIETASILSASSIPSSMRDKVSQEIENLAGHVTDSITGVAGVVNFLITRTAEMAPGPRTIEDVRNVLSGTSLANGSVTAESFRDGLFRKANASLRPRTDSVLPNAQTGSKLTPKEDASGTSISDRPTLSNRLASLARFRSSSPEAGKSDAKKPLVNTAASYPIIAQPDLVTNDFGPPIERFMSGNVDELVMGDVAILLADYRRLARLVTQQQLTD